MKLLLTSGGIANKTIERSLRDLLGKAYDRSSLTFIPTAADAHSGDKKWLIKDLINFNNLGFKNFDIADIAASPKKIWMKSMESADVIVVGGGEVSFLMEKVNDSGLSKLFCNYLEDKIYVGISAGSMILSKQIGLTSDGLDFYRKNNNFQIINGLGYIDFEIRPHFGSTSRPEITPDFLDKISKEYKKTFYAIDDNTAIKVIDGKVEVVSEGTWRKFN